ncbi:hypothetical protein VTO73DRAFT_8104 [Trametes versicolor]
MVTESKSRGPLRVGGRSDDPCDNDELASHAHLDLNHHLTTLVDTQRQGRDDPWQPAGDGPLEGAEEAAADGKGQEGECRKPAAAEREGRCGAPGEAEEEGRGESGIWRWWHEEITPLPGGFPTITHRRTSRIRAVAGLARTDECDGPPGGEAEGAVGVGRVMIVMMFAFDLSLPCLETRPELCVIHPSSPGSHR